MSNTELVERFQKIDPPTARSAFLWGPRKTGKTTLLRQQFPEACWIDLLDYDLFLSLSQRPSSLREILDAQGSKTVVIDEVQKVPNLMDEIHWLIENRGYQFILCGSSARKVRRGKSGLLGGRAWRFELYPLVTKELKSFDLDRALHVEVKLNDLMDLFFLSIPSQTYITKKCRYYLILRIDLYPLSDPVFQYSTIPCG